MTTMTTQDSGARSVASVKMGNPSLVFGKLADFQGKRLYPDRVSDTLSYDLTQGDVSEQTLYDETTHYIDYYYRQQRRSHTNPKRERGSDEIK